jgi:hypothetical protein
VQVVLDPTPDTRAAFVGKASTQRTWGWVTVAVGGAVLAGGATFFLLNGPKKSDAQGEYDAALKEQDHPTSMGICDWRNGFGGGSSEACSAVVTQKYNALQDKKHLGTYSLIGAGVGAAVAVLGVYIVASGDNPHKYDRERPRTDAARPTIVPTVSWGGDARALGVAGVF